MINLVIPACPLCGRTNLQREANEKHFFYLCKTHGWFSKNEIKASMLENIVEDSSPFVPPHRKNVSTQEFSAIAQEYEGKLKNPLEFGIEKRNNYAIAHIAKALAGEQYLPNGKRVWFWKDRTEKAREFYKKIDYRQLTESQHNTLKKMISVLGKNSYLNEKRRDVLSQFYVMNKEPLKAVQTSLRAYTAPLQHGLEKIVKRKSWEATACALSVQENTPPSQNIKNPLAGKFKKSDIKYYVFLAGMVGLLASGWSYLMYHCGNLAPQKTEQRIVVVDETKVETPQESPTFYLPLEGKLLDIAKKKGLWGIGKHLGVDNGKNNRTIIGFTQEAGSLNYLPKNDMEKDGILYDLWAKENLHGGKLEFSQEMVEKYHIDTEKLQH